MARSWLVLVSSTLVLGCVGLRPPVPTDAAPAPASGYVAGVFHVDEKTDFAVGFAFGLRDGKGREYVLPFSYSGRPGLTPESQVGMMALPPGDYRVTTWYLYDAFQSVRMRQPIPRDAPLARPFSVAPGSVVLLGRFEASSVTKLNVLAAIGGWVQGEWRLSFYAEATREDEAFALLRRRYPGFADAPVACVLCSSPEGAQGCSTPPPPIGDYAPPHRVVLHYHRADGGYAGWGLHVWDQPTGKPIRFLPGVSWETPLGPDGVDAFGAYWVLSDAAFQSGRVTYKLHKGDEKDQGGGDRSWLLADSHEAWVVSGDPAVHATRPALPAAAP